MHYESIKNAVLSFSRKRVTVVGDLMLDLYTFGDVSRISPEAPIPIVRKTHKKFFLGGAANVANNLVDLGAKVTLCGFVGNDYSREIFMKLKRTRY
jgi:D-beta-D-heptose 7-phosphate kinase/D-beta-D-heptose 1-phosphate adenosyltransferase